MLWQALAGSGLLWPALPLWPALLAVLWHALPAGSPALSSPAGLCLALPHCLLSAGWWQVVACGGRLSHLTYMFSYVVHPARCILSSGPPARRRLGVMGPRALGFLQELAGCPDEVLSWPVFLGQCGRVVTMVHGSWHVPICPDSRQVPIKSTSTYSYSADVKL